MLSRMIDVFQEKMGEFFDRTKKCFQHQKCYVRSCLCIVALAGIQNVCSTFANQLIINYQTVIIFNTIKTNQLIIQ